MAAACETRLEPQPLQPRPCNGHTTFSLINASEARTWNETKWCWADFSSPSEMLVWDLCCNLAMKTRLEAQAAPLNAMASNLATD